MRHAIPLIVSFWLALVPTGCKKTNTVSNIPYTPVNLNINTTVMVNLSIGSYIIVNEKGYHYNDVILPLLVNEYCGYAGVVIYLTSSSTYKAFDLCCPHCINKNYPLDIDGFFATCPLCGEEYELYNGFGMPTKGISKENLLTYPVYYNYPHIRVHN